MSWKCSTPRWKATSKCDPFGFNLSLTTWPQSAVMTTRIFTLSLTASERCALQTIAADQQTDLRHLLHRLVAAEISRHGTSARTSDRTKEQLLAPLRALLACNLAMATGWSDLQARLRGNGYALRKANGGLALATSPGGNRVCKASDLGYRYADLMRRFGRPFPGGNCHNRADGIDAPNRR